jgi:hypothetical protein
MQAAWNQKRKGESEQSRETFQRFIILPLLPPYPSSRMQTRRSAFFFWFSA